MSRSDRGALLVMVAIPTLLFALPAMLGHPAITQDNLIQNYPLRVLTGSQIASGHLPLLNPLANSGTPLLGGMNAGSLFPLTLLFVFLPGILAWVLNLIAVYVASALGMFALLRWHGVGTRSALIPALVFSYSGAMIGQLVHLGVIQGFAMLPWATLVLLALARAVEQLPSGTTARHGARAVLGYVIGLATLWGLTSLTGEPRAIAEMQLLAIIVVPIVLLVRSSFQPSTWRRRVLYVVGVGVGISWGALIGLAQLLTGWSFINVSQRTGLTYQFFGAGSLPVRWTSLLMLPDIVGGNGVLHQPRFFVHYNLPEVTGYVGVLALVGAAGFVAQFTRRGWRGANRNYVVYIAIVVVGLFAAWGSFTPLGHLFQAIPLFASTRLQSRNIVLADFGLAVLLGWWLQHLSERDFLGAGLVGRRRWLTLSPALAVTALCVVMLFAGPWTVLHLGATKVTATWAHFELPTLLAHLFVASGAVALLTWGMTRRHLMRWLSGIIALDTLLFFTFCAIGFVAGDVTTQPSRAFAISELGHSGRFALVDPSGAHQNDFENLGSPNMNVFTRLPSVQGYGSLINALYGNVTLTHPRFQLNACKLADGVFRQLRLASIVVSTLELATPVSHGTTASLSCLPLQSAEKTQRYFGQMLDVRTISLVGFDGQIVAAGKVRARLFNAYGKPFGPTLTQPGTVRMSFSFRSFDRAAAGVEFHAATGALIGSTIVQPKGAHAQAYRLTTPFQQALSSLSWQVAHTTGSVTIFKATSLRRSAWLGGNISTSRITNITNASWGDSWISVDATHTTVLKRSMEWIPGWRATALNEKTGKTEHVRVVRSGLIQQVTVPKGSWTIHFHYHAPHIEVGLAGSLLGLVAWVAALSWLRGWVPRRRKEKVRA